VPYDPPFRKDSHAIPAYSLPYKRSQTRHIDLDGSQPGDPNLFFTAQLTGFRLEVGANPKPRVAHIAGNFNNQVVDRFGNTAMDREAAAAFGESRRRKFSVRTGYPDVDMVAVIGVGESGLWNLYAQGKEQTTGAGGWEYGLVKWVKQLYVPDTEPPEQ
jgi:hypothetical protein